MRVLIAGASGYIGTRLTQCLVEAGHQVTALVRNKRRLPLKNVTIIEGDLLSDRAPLFPKEIDVAYYLVHSISHKHKGFYSLEERSAQNFLLALEKTEAKQIIYLSGLVKGTAKSEHMSSRHNVEEVLESGSIPLTIFRAGIILGAGSASFEIMYDLVRKLPIMVAPKWVRSHCQPIAISDVLFYLQSALGNKECYGKRFEIGGPDTLTYHEMLHGLAKAMGKRRYILLVPVLTPYLSSLWLYLVTKVNFSLARALVQSLTVDAICSEESIKQIIPHKCLDFVSAINKAVQK